ncbi:MAG: RNA polymerase sigma-70 factor [Bacteroidales bacterium]
MKKTNNNYNKLHFQEFFNDYFPKVKSFALQILKSEEDAEDIAQDIFVKIWENPELWADKAKSDSYLYVTTRNQIYNFLKHKTVELNHLEATARKMQITEQKQVDQSDELHAKELELLIQMAIENMPKQRKRIFLMSRQDNMSNQEIADKLNISVRTTEHHIYQALQDLKKIILFFFIIGLSMST